jgi:hypothetical protein
MPPPAATASGATPPRRSSSTHPAYGGVLDVSRTAQTLGGNANANVSVGGQLA